MGLDVRWCIVVRLVLLLALAHIHVRGRHVGLAVLIGLVLWSTVHAREVRCATNRWRHGPGRRDAFPFRIPREQSVPTSFFAPCCTHCTAETRPTLGGLCLAWPVSELGMVFLQPQNRGGVNTCMRAFWTVPSFLFCHMELVASRSMQSYHVSELIPNQMAKASWIHGSY